MLDWLGNQNDSLNLLINFAMLAVWAVYLHLLLVAYRRQRKPKILVNRGAGTGTQAHCLVSNMGAEPVYVHSVLTTLRTERQEWTMAVTDIESLGEEEHGRDPSHLPRDPSPRTSQGPLTSGQYLDIGTFGDLAGHTWRQSETQSVRIEELPDGFRSLEVLVIASCGADDLPIGACRTFAFTKNADSEDLVPTRAETRQIDSRRGRRRMHVMLERNL